MAEIKVTSSELRKKAEELKQYNTKFRSEVTKMVGYQQSLNGMWEGDAKEAFNKAFEKDKNRFETFAKNIDTYYAQMLEIAKTYENAEKTNTSIASQRKV